MAARPAEQQALWRGVYPGLLSPALAPDCSSSCTMGTLPQAAAWWRGVDPAASAAATVALALMRSPVGGRVRKGPEGGMVVGVGVRAVMFGSLFITCMHVSVAAGVHGTEASCCPPLPALHTCHFVVHSSGAVGTPVQRRAPSAVLAVEVHACLEEGR